jgi:hypothetical protein
MKMRVFAALIAVLVFFGIAESQTPQPISGRDYDSSTYRLVRVDSLGRLETITSGNAAACDHQTAIVLSSQTDFVLAASGGAVKTKICHISFGISSAVNASIVQGTGSFCATGNTSLTGAYNGTAVLALDFGPDSPLQNTATNVDTCLHFASAVTGGGVVIYGQQ